METTPAQITRMYDKAYAVVKSVTTVEQLEAAQRYVDLFIKRIPKSLGYLRLDGLKSLLKEKKTILIQEP